MLRPPPTGNDECRGRSRGNDEGNDPFGGIEEPVNERARDQPAYDGQRARPSTRDNEEN
jgi:hypothetical protein